MLSACPRVRFVYDSTCVTWLRSTTTPANRCSILRAKKCRLLFGREQKTPCGLSPCWMWNVNNSTSNETIDDCKYIHLGGQWQCEMCVSVPRTSDNIGGMYLQSLSCEWCAFACVCVDFIQSILCGDRCRRNPKKNTCDEYRSRICKYVCL